MSSIPLPTPPNRTTPTSNGQSNAVAHTRPVSTSGGIPTPARYKLTTSRPESVGSAMLLNGGDVDTVPAMAQGLGANRRTSVGEGVSGRSLQRPGFYGGTGGGTRDSPIGSRPASSASIAVTGGRSSPLPSSVNPLSPSLAYQNRPQSSLASYTIARSDNLAPTPTSAGVMSRTAQSHGRSSSVVGSTEHESISQNTLGPAFITTSTRATSSGGTLLPVGQHKPAITPPAKDESTNIRVYLRIRPASNQTLDPTLPQRLKRVVIFAKEPNSATVGEDRDGFPKEVIVQTGPNTQGGGVAPDLPTSHSTSSSSSGTINSYANPSQSGTITGKTISFTYDRVLPEQSTQEEAYEVAGRGAVNRFLDGYNACLLAYGQTSSGKSYTMGTTGLPEDYVPTRNGSSPTDAQASERVERMGIIPRAVKDVFAGLAASSEENDSSVVKVSFLELYQEELIDLLSTAPAGMSPNIILREDKDGRTLVFGMREVIARSPEDVMRCLEAGSRRRRVGRTDMNESSSRSHAILSLTLTQAKVLDATGSGERQPGKMRSRSITRPVSTSHLPGIARSGTTSPTKDGHRSSMLAPSSFKAVMANGRSSPSGLSATREITSRFHFVDLAGSERLKRTGAANEQRVKEGISINGGLLSLSNVISALADPSKTGNNFVPFRTSKLTRMLKDSLGGDSHTVMIACASALEANLAETINTLKYASRAMKITNAVKQNMGTEFGWDDVDYLRGLVVNLRKRLAEEASGSNAADDEMNSANGTSKAQLRLDLEAANDALRELTLKNARLMADHDSTGQSGEAKEKDPAFLEAVGPIIDEYEKIVEKAEADLQHCRAELRICQEVLDEHKVANAETAATLATQATYVDELRRRIVKARENEGSIEEHLRQVEIECQQYMDLATVIESKSDLQSRELIKLKDSEARMAMYVSELEGNLTQESLTHTKMVKRLHDLERDIADKEKALQQVQVSATHFDRAGASEAGNVLRVETERDTDMDAPESGLEEDRTQTITDGKSSSDMSRSSPLETPSATSSRAVPTIIAPAEASSQLEQHDMETQLRLRQAEERVKELETMLVEKENVFVMPARSPPSTSSKLSPRWRSSTQTNQYQTWAADFRGGEGQGGRPVLKRLSLSAGPWSPSSQGSSQSLLSLKLSRQSLPALRTVRSPTSYESEIRQLQSSLDLRERQLADVEGAIKAMSPSATPSPTKKIPIPQDPMQDGLTDESDNQEEQSPVDGRTPSEGDSEGHRIASLMHAFAAKEALHRAEMGDLSRDIARLQRELVELKGQPKSKIPLEREETAPSVVDCDVIGFATPSEEPSTRDLTAGSKGVERGEERNRAECLAAELAQQSEERGREQERVVCLEGALEAKASELADTMAIVNVLSAEKAALADEVAQLQQSSALAASQLSDTKLSVEMLGLQRVSLMAQIDGLETAGAARASEHAVLQKQLDVALAEKAALTTRADQLQQDLNTRAVAPATPVFTSRVSLGSRTVSTPTQKGVPPPGPPPGVPPPPLPQLDIPGDGQKRSSGEGLVRRRPSMPNMTADFAPSPVSPAAEKMLAQLREKEDELKATNAKLVKCQGDLRASMDLISNLESSLATSEKGLRKTRLQLTESSKEREDLDREVTRLNEKNWQIESEMSSVRRSVTIEKQSLEDRLSAEVRQKEIAKRQLEERLSAAQLAKQGRFKCF